MDKILRGFFLIKNLDKIKEIKNQIKIAKSKKDYTKTVNLYKELIELDKKNIKYNFELIGQALLGDDIATASFFLKKMKSIDSNDSLYILSQGRFYYKLKDFNNMRRVFFLLYDDIKYQEEAFEKNFNSYMIEKDFEVIYNLLHKNRPNFLVEYKFNFLKGKYYFLKRNYKKAKEFFQASIRENKEYEQSYIWLTKCNFKLENYRDSKDSLSIAYKNITNKNYIIQLNKLERQIENLNNRVLLIGTCRIKRMRAFIDDNTIKARIALISSHVHYTQEIKQMLFYLQWKNIDKDLLGVIVDDINVGKLNSYQEVEDWRNKTLGYLNNSQKVIIEISSLKKFLLRKKPDYYGNITALKSVIGKRNRIAKFIPLDNLKKEFFGLKPSFSDKEEIINEMREIKKILPNKEILWLSHFRYFIDDKNKEIEERIRLNKWVLEGAKILGDDYLDQTKLIDYLGQEKALKDSSHYSEESEKLMARIITFWIKQDKVPNIEELNLC